MAGARQVRWQCPNDLHPGVLGPTRPRKENIVRYCLPCSMKEGKLVERVAPAMDKKRADRKEVTQARAKKKQDRKRTAERRLTHIAVREIDGSMGEVNVKRTIKRMMGLDAIQKQARRNYRSTPNVTVRYSQRKVHSSGHAYPGGDIVVTIGSENTRERVEELLLHELAHVVAPSAAHHGPLYRTIFTRAAHEWWPGIRVSADDGNIYDLGQKVIAEAERIAKEATS